jgi:acyl CoA:acetate/3-ketoacid CoA transferase alpha subunit
VKDGDVLFVGGFGMTGNPVHLLHALAKKATKNLTYIANNVGEPNLGGGKIITELAVFGFHESKLCLLELMPGVTLEEVRSKTTASFEIRL